MQRNQKSIENEEEQARSYVDIIRVYCLPEGFRNAERQTCNEVLEICHEKEHCAFVGGYNVRKCFLILEVWRLIKRLILHVEVEEELEDELD